VSVPSASDPKTMDGFIASRPIPGCEGGGIVPPPPVLAPGRRSGRVPALPYPPPGLLDCTSGHSRSAIGDSAALDHDGGGEDSGGSASRGGERYGVRSRIRLNVWILIYLRIGGWSASGSRSSEATDLSCHLL
jgi:hypothetical protein